MTSIERLFGGKRAVHGLRSSERAAREAAVDDMESVALPADPEGGEASSRDPVESLLEEVGEPAPAPHRSLAIFEPIAVRPGPELLSAHSQMHPHSERVRLLRTELLLRHPNDAGAIAIAVVGAGAGEGRSRLAAELALAFSQLDRSTLLIDADMRNPRQHLLFGTPLGDGLAQAIVREDSPVLCRVEGYPTLSLVTAGQCPPNPLELLSDGRFQNLMESLRHSFEFIIVDTPRCSDFADGLVVANVIGRVLTVHRACHTTYKAAREMLRQLASGQVDVLGGVLNHF